MREKSNSISRSIGILFFILVNTIASKGQQRIIDSLEERILTLKVPNQIFSEKSVLILKYYTTGNSKKAFELLRKTINDAGKTNSDFGLGSCYNTQGTLYYYESKFDSALFYYIKSMEYRKAAKDTIGELKTFCNIGSMYYLNNELKKALEYYEAGLRKEQELKFEEGEHVPITNIGKIYNSLRMSSKAINYLLSAEKLYLKRDKPGQLVYTYDGLSTSYKDLKNYDSALYYSNKVRNISGELEDLNSMAYSELDIGILYLNLKLYEKAEQHFGEAIKFNEKLGDKRLEIGILGNFAAIQIENKSPEKANPFIERILEIQKNLNIKVNREDYANLFAEYYFSKKDYKSAYENLRLYSSFKDSIFNIETASQIADMQEKYQTEKKEKENLILAAENKAVTATRNYLVFISVFALIALTGATFAYNRIKNAKLRISFQKDLIEEKQKEILDSINYAKRIQDSLLVSKHVLSKYLPQHFVLLSPKDVVSGDFYWGTPVGNEFIYVTADCTGHGVPGAFMSLLNISKLNQVVTENKIIRPDLILNQIRTEIILALNANEDEDESKDGMDAIICKINFESKTLEYAAANNSFYIIRNKEIIVCKADKMPVGKGLQDEKPFTYNKVNLQVGDMIYTFTDGYADQFGGKAGKKFKYKPFEEFLLSISEMDLDKQKENLKLTFENWKGNLEQVDDVCIIGVRVV